MRRLILAAFAGAGLAGFASAGANAMPVAPQQPASPLVQHAAQGCGPGFARGPRGYCRPMRAYGPRCFVRRTPYGPRRVCR